MWAAEPLKKHPATARREFKLEILHFKTERAKIDRPPRGFTSQKTGTTKWKTSKKAGNSQVRALSSQLI